MNRRGVDEMKSLNAMLKQQPLERHPSTRPPSADRWKAWVFGAGWVGVLLALMWATLGAPTDGGIILLFALVGVAIYFLPSIVALHRGHRNAEGIAILNLLLGWTLVGWAVALVWAVYRERTG